MPKVLAMEEMGNFEVKQWMAETKKRHEREDREAEAQGLVLKPRPANLKKAFEKHERHLNRDVYPYAKNPSVYNENYDIDEVVDKFNHAVVNRVHRRVLKKYQEKVRSGELTKKQAEEQLEAENDPKIFSEMELMQLHNLAPRNVEGLQLIIEQWEERFTEDEMSLILDAIMEILRPDELAAKEQDPSGLDTGSDGQGVADSGAEEQGLGETAKMSEAIRELSPFSARSEMTTTAVASAAGAGPSGTGVWLPLRGGAPAAAAPGGVVPTTGANAAEMGPARWLPAEEEKKE